jgi:hypothetical protein
MSSIKSLIRSGYEYGKNVVTNFRRVNATAATAGMWVDLSMSTGTPTPNYYVGGELEATVPTAWYKKGIWHGGSVSPEIKRLHKFSLLGASAAAAPAPYILCDYLMYYPLIDMDSSDEQSLINTTNSLPRYTDGVGVKAFLVATNPYIGGATFQIRYTNSDGVANRISQINTTNTGTNIGTLVNSNTAGLRNFGAFIELAAGDKGIRSVQSITFFSPNGGLAALVLVKPIATMMTREATAWAEFDFLKDKISIPVIEDGAYLNLLVMPSATLAAVAILGEATFIWEA